MRIRLQKDYQIDGLSGMAGFHLHFYTIDNIPQYLAISGLDLMEVKLLGYTVLKSGKITGRGVDRGILN